jgi:hypothetical protein
MTRRWEITLKTDDEKNEAGLRLCVCIKSTVVVDVISCLQLKRTAFGGGKQQVRANWKGGKAPVFSRLSLERESETQKVTSSPKQLRKPDEGNQRGGRD